jgi:5'-3' exonuclease
VLARYGRLEDIPLEASRWDVPVRGAGKLAATLRHQIGDALLYRFLATLRRDVPLSESLEDLEWRGVPAEPFEAFCALHGFESLADRVPHWA